jgi:hypothetical protein
MKEILQSIKLIYKCKKCNQYLYSINSQFNWLILKKILYKQSGFLFIINMSAGKVNMALDDIIDQKKSARKDRKIQPVKRANDRVNQNFQKRRFGGNRQFSNNRGGSNFKMNRGNSRGGMGPRRGGFNARNNNRNQIRNDNRNRSNFNGQNNQRRRQVSN